MKDIRPTKNPDILRVMRDFREIDVPAIRDGYEPPALRLRPFGDGYKMSRKRRFAISQGQKRAWARRKAEDAT